MEQKIKIVKCSNRYFWYRKESKKKGKRKKTFIAEECEDKRGLLVPVRGFVFYFDLEIID